MTNKIDILGIVLDNATVRDMIARVDRFLDTHAMNVIEAVSMQMLVDSENDEVLREVLSSLDLAVIGEKEILLEAGERDRQRIREIEDNDFSYAFFGRMELRQKSIFLLGNTGGRIDAARERLRGDFPKLAIAGEYAVAECTGDLETVINEMNATTPDVIFSLLPTPMQEHFLNEHRDKMSASIWYGIGELGITAEGRGMKRFFRRMMHRGHLKSSMGKYREKEE